jgi:hypothetical protein
MNLKIKSVLNLFLFLLFLVGRLKKMSLFERQNSGGIFRKKDSVWLRNAFELKSLLPGRGKVIKQCYLRWV